MSEADADASVRRVTWVLLALSVLLSLLVVRRPVSRLAEGAEAYPLTLVPSGPRLLLTVDVSRLTRVAAAELRALGGDELLGLQQLCGFEPLLALERVVLAMPYDGDDGAADFALIAATSLDVEQGLACAERVVRSRGGSPARSRLGAFTSVRDAKKPLGELALRGDGLFVLSGGKYFRDVMDAAARAAHPDEAAELRTRLHRRLRAELGDAELALTLLPDDGSALRGVVALGLALRVERDGPSLRGLLACTSPADCDTAREVLEDVKRELSQDPALRALAQVSVRTAGARLLLEGRLPRAALLQLLSRSMGR